MPKNYNCDGAHCLAAHGEVRLYPLGGGAHLILCRACWTHENRYRAERARTTDPRRFPQVAWDTAEVYGAKP